MTKWNKKWDKEGLSTREGFMWHSQDEAEKSSRAWIRQFIASEGVRTVGECGIGPAIDLQAIVTSRISLEKYVGFDISSGYKESYPSLPTWFEFRLLENPYKWPCEQAEFGLVYSRHVIEHQPSPHEMLAQAARATQKWVAIVFFRIPTQLSYHKIQRANKDFYFNDLSAPLLEKEAADLDLYVVEKRPLVSATKEAKENELWLFRKCS